MIENQSVKVQVETCPSTPPPDGKVKANPCHVITSREPFVCWVVQDIVNKKRHFDGEVYSTTFDIGINAG